MYRSGGRGRILAAHEPKAARSAETRASQRRQCGADVAVFERCGNHPADRSLWATSAAGSIGAPVLFSRLRTRANWLARPLRTKRKIATGTRVTRLLQNIDGWVAETTLGYELRARFGCGCDKRLHRQPHPGPARERHYPPFVPDRYRPDRRRNLDDVILPGGQAVSDSRRILATSADRQTAGWSSAGEAAWQNRIGRKLGVTSSAQCVGPIPTSPKCR